MKTIPVGKRHTAIVDDEDFDKLSQMRWYWTCGYAVTLVVIDGKIKRRGMHRMITNAPAGVEVDHINGKELDNRRENLRLCTRAENNRNRPKQRNNSSGYKGVTKCGSGWRARISINNKIITKAGFKTPKEAYAEYCRLSAEHHGSFGNVSC